MTLRFTLNGRPMELEADGSRRLKYKECCGRNQ